MWVRRVPLVGVVVVMLLVTSGCGWWQAGFDAGHSAFNPVELRLTPSTVGSLRQRFTLSSPGRSYKPSPIVVAGSVYATSIDSPLATTNTARLEAFGAVNGAPRWSTTLTTDATGVTDPVYADGTIYVATGDDVTFESTIWAVAPATGAVKWHAVIEPPTSFGSPSDPVVDHGKLLFTFRFARGPADVLLAADGSTGATLWTSNVVGSAGMSGAPLVMDGRVAVPTFVGPEPVTEVFNEADGSAAEHGTLGLLAYTAANHLLYGVSTNSSFTEFEPLAVDPSSGTTVWTGSQIAGFPGVAGFAVTDHHAVFGTSSAGLTAYDAKSGASQWSVPGPPGACSTPACPNDAAPVIAGDVMYVATSSGQGGVLTTYNLATGAALGSVALPPLTSGGLATTVVADGHVYVSLNGTITAFAPS